MSEPRVLLIDDDENILTVLEMRLEAGGYEVHTARDGAEAAGEGPPLCVGVDGVMTRQIFDQGGVVGDFHGDAAMGL